ncbi:MAG: tRNA lysidine(34) synthetase TilS, partial [Sediminispirochaetaceae bacterium]
MNSIEKILLNRVRTFLRKNSIESGSTLITAYSGGPDSTALLLLLSALRHNYPFTLRAVYIEHGIREKEERLLEDQLVGRITEQLGVPLWRLYLPPGYIETHAANAGGTEAAARTMRYDFFEKLSGNGAYILPGHTLDDLLETQVMRFFQGSGPSGLSGIPERRGPFLRPLLSVKKEEIYAYLAEKNARYSVDSTNTGEDFLRNRVRKELMPVVRSIFPGIERSLHELAGKMKALEVCEDTQRGLRSSSVFDGKSIPLREEDDGSISFDAELFVKAPEWEKSRLIYSLWDSTHKKKQTRLPYRFVRELCKTFVEENSLNREKKIIEGHGIAIARRGDRFFYSHSVVPEKKKSYLKLIEEGDIHLPSGIDLQVAGLKGTERCGGGEKAGGEQVAGGEKAGSEQVAGGEKAGVLVYTSEQYGPLV